MSLRRSSDNSGSCSTVSRLNAVLRAGEAERNTAIVTKDGSYERGRRWFTKSKSIEDWKNDLYDLIEKRETDMTRVGYAEMMHQTEGYLGLEVYLTKGEFMYSYRGRMSDKFQTKEKLAEEVMKKIRQLGYEVIDTYFRFTLS